MKFHRAKKVKIIIAEPVIQSIFDECDRFPEVETGGRLIGFYENPKKELCIHVDGMIDAGQNAERARVSLFQDGEYQEKIFRHLEEEYPNIEHFGTWHSHHVNGLQHLSSGDLDTYHRTANHHNQNTDFWYALLIVKKTGGKERYEFKNYIFFRNDKKAYEIDKKNVIIERKNYIWIPGPQEEEEKKEEKEKISSTRGADARVMEKLFSNFESFLSKSLGVVYWRGTFNLIDGTPRDVLVLEEKGSYSAKVTGSSKGEFEDFVIEGRDAPWLALYELQQLMNKQIFKSKKLRRG